MTGGRLEPQMRSVLIPCGASSFKQSLMQKALAILLLVTPWLVACALLASQVTHAKEASPQSAKTRALSAKAKKQSAKRAVTKKTSSNAQARPAPALRTAALPTTRDGETEARLIEVYKLAGQAQNREALRKAEALVRDHPNFQLAQLVYGDLLASQIRSVNAVGDVPASDAKAAAPMLAALRQESRLRLQALRERPAPGMVPSQFVGLSPLNKHAIAVDASRSRLYLFENTEAGIQLVADYYISVGKLGVEKNLEGDQRTPIGVYFISSNLDPKSLRDFYGSGALPINYPNQLDVRRGKTGGGIWLHGTPPTQFSRAPLATDGCVVLANPDLERIIKTVEIRNTPVVIANSLKWVSPQSLKSELSAFDDMLQGWHRAKASGDLAKLAAWYTPDFTSYGKTLTQWLPMMQAELKQLAGRDIQIKDVSYLRWTDSADTMVVTFGELVKGSKTGRTKRQYWTRQGSQWKIFFEGSV